MLKGEKWPHLGEPIQYSAMRFELIRVNAKSVLKVRQSLCILGLGRRDVVGMGQVLGLRDPGSRVRGNLVVGASGAA